MGVRIASRRDLAAELERVKRHIDHAVSELSDARDRMGTNTPTVLAKSNPEAASTSRESDLANLCISLELALADSVTWAQRLAEKMREDRQVPGAGLIGAIDLASLRRLFRVVFTLVWRHVAKKTAGVDALAATNAHRSLQHPEKRLRSSAPFRAALFCNHGFTVSSTGC